MTDDGSAPSPARWQWQWRTHGLILVCAWVFLLSVAGVGWAVRVRFAHTDQKREQQQLVNQATQRQLKAQRHVLAELCRTNTILAALVEATAERMKVDNPAARELRAVYYGYLVELHHRSACREVIGP